MSDPEITLRELKPENIVQAIKLEVKPEQKPFVARNAASIAQAYVFQDRAWPRLIYADATPVGFLMLELMGPDHPEAPKGRASYFLWRLMIGAEHQGKGFGRQAILAVLIHVRTLPDAEHLDTSYVPDKPGNPGPFYEGLGFKPTGAVDEDGEIELRIKL